MKKEMLINVLQPEECRIAILEDGVLEELYVERTSHESYVGNIYKGRIVNIEPSIQAAFVDFGVGRNGFLHVSDVEPTYYRHLEQRRGERGGRRDRGRDHDRRRAPMEFEVEDLDAESLAPLDDASTLLPDEAALDVQSAEEVVEITEEQMFPGVDAFAEETLEETGEEASVAEMPAESEMELDTDSSVTALPETRIDEEPTRRRRSRGRTRSRKSAAAETPAEETPAEETERPAAAGASEEAAAESQEKPPYMGSAERRTTEKDPEISPSGSDSGISDEELLFFPRESESAAEPPAPEPIEEPELEPREEEYSRPSAPIAPPPRARPALSERRGSIEDDLAADLEAAEIGPLGSEPTAPPVYAEEIAEPVESELEPEPELPPRHTAREDDSIYEGPRRHRDDRRDAGPTDRRDAGPTDRRDAGPTDRRRRNGHRDRDRGRNAHRDRGRGGFRRDKPLIQDIFKRGQEVLVQVIKEGLGTKGPTLSTYISIAGRYLVLMPGLNRVGVSRKIADDEQRRRLREIFNELKPPRGLGFIIRTAGIDKNKKELQRDLLYLSRLWQVVVRRIRKMKAPAEIYQESDMITRTIRDTFTNDIDTIWVDEASAFEHAQEFLQIVMPRYAARIKLYEGKEPLFHKYGIEEEIARIQQRKVPLPHGGSIVIEQTEALVAIDVNSGNFRADNNAEETAYQMNLQAAKEIARQLRLRDLGGVIVNDFIDMREEKHRRGVEKAMRDAVKRDRARTKILKISAFGLIEMTRQRIRPSLKRSVYQDCPYCHGMAQVKTCESMSIDVMRMIQLAAHREYVHHIEIRVAEDVANYLLNKKRREIARLEEAGNILVQIRGTSAAPPETLEFVCYDNNNNEVKLFPTELPMRPRR
ncbi:MAG TPA: Rne/Rng family ribonuclease [Gemmataceae bacterium]|nr:Rne/Rng family ribonuclease [Gemmataceae bacterium]